MGQEDPEALLTDSVTPLVRLLKQHGYSDKQCIEEFSYCGFGILQQVNAKTWITPSSHYGEAIYTHGKPYRSCYFTSGYIQGLVNQPVIEVECQVEGAPEDGFECQEQPLHIVDYLQRPLALSAEIPERFQFPECQSFHTRVDEAAIIEAVNSLPLYGKMGEDDTGLIDAFGVVLTNHFADYYNRISYETYFALQKAGLPEAESKEMFIQAGHVCAFNTFGGIMSSPEWHAVVEPFCDNREDWFHGLIAVLNTLGWGIFRLEKIAVEQELIVRLYNAYEGVGYRRLYNELAADKNISFLAMGAVLGMVHLLWKVDIRTKPTLNQEFYVQQFNNPENSYHVEQTHAIADGDAFDRFVVSQ